MRAYGSIHVRIPKQGTNTCVSSSEGTGKAESTGVVHQTLFSAFCSISHALVPISSDWKNWDIPQLEHAYKNMFRGSLFNEDVSLLLKSYLFPWQHRTHSHADLCGTAVSSLQSSLKVSDDNLGLFFPCCLQFFKQRWSKTKKNKGSQTAETFQSIKKSFRFTSGALKDTRGNGSLEEKQVIWFLAA